VTSGCLGAPWGCCQLSWVKWATDFGWETFGAPATKTRALNIVSSAGEIAFSAIRPEEREILRLRGGQSIRTLGIL
jgi:hypothetical protein